VSVTLDADFEFTYPRGATVTCRWRHEFDGRAVTVLLGASGSGKTTVLRCLAGLERPRRGHIRWSDAAAGVHVAPERRDVGVLFQDYALFPHLDVRRNIGFAAGAVLDQKARRRVDELIELFRLRGLELRRPLQLSGGQQQPSRCRRSTGPRGKRCARSSPRCCARSPSPPTSSPTIESTR
jgi:molybdate transport system ATP-binding protein